MASAAELDARAELDHAHGVAVFLAEEGYSSHSIGLGHSGIALLFERHIAADQGVDLMLHLAYLGIGELLEVAEVEAEVVVADI